MPGVPTAQPYGSDLPRSVTAGGGGGRDFSGVCFSSLPLPSISSLDYRRALLEKGRCSGRDRPIPEEQGRGGSGAEGVLAAPRAELLNPRHRLYSWLI